MAETVVSATEHALEPRRFADPRRGDLRSHSDVRRLRRWHDRLVGTFADPRLADSSVGVRAGRVEFAPNSQLEGGGFEPSVPRSQRSPPWPHDLLQPMNFPGVAYPA
jgi:hypothetical protein